MFEEPYFSRQSTTISHELATRTDHSMTGDDDDDTIVVVGSANSSDGSGTRDHLRLFPIAASLPVWDFL
jgi:hypothetical protein